MINFVNKATAYLTIPLAIIVVWCALLRYVFHAMPDWGFEMAIFIFGIQIMFGGIFCHKKGKHIAVDILPKYLPEKANMRLKMLYELVTFFVCAVIIYASYSWAWDSFLIGERSMNQTVFNPPIWWFKAIIPVGALLMCVQTVDNFFVLLQVMVKKERL